MQNNPKLTALPAGAAAWASVQQVTLHGCKLKVVPAEIATGWKECAFFDVQSKGKKKSCKLTEEFLFEMDKTHITGFAMAKKKKGKKGKKK